MRPAGPRASTSLAEAYQVRLAPSAVAAISKVSPELRNRIIRALRTQAANAAGHGPIGGKRVKTIHGTQDSFERLRVGDYRVMFDLIHGDRVLLVLGIVHRRDLERWIRNR